MLFTSFLSPTRQLPKQIVQYHMSKQIMPDGGGGQSLEDEDDQHVDVDVRSKHLPHLLGEESVDMAEVSAYVSPCSSTDESDVSNEQSREEQDVLVTLAFTDNRIQEAVASENWNEVEKRWDELQN